MLVGIVVLAVVGVVVYLVVSDDDDDTTTDDDTTETTDDDTAETDDPEAVVRAFIDADTNNDCDTLLGLSTSNVWSQLTGSSDHAEALDTCETNLGELEDEGITIEYTVHSVEIIDDGEDRVVVEAEATQENAGGATEETIDFTQELTLINEDGDWKLDDLGEVTEH